jgi:hypothetical protein
LYFSSIIRPNIVVIVVIIIIIIIIIAAVMIKMTRLRMLSENFVHLFMPEAEGSTVQRDVYSDPSLLPLGDLWLRHVYRHAFHFKIMSKKRFKIVAHVSVKVVGMGGVCMTVFCNKA